MREEPVWELLDSIKRHAAAWTHRSNVEVHPAVQSAFLSCASELEHTIRQYHEACDVPPSETDEDSGVKP